MSMPADHVPVPRRTAHEQLSEIDLVDRRLEAILAMLEAAGENRMAASHVHELLLMARTPLPTAIAAMNRLLGR